MAGRQDPAINGPSRSTAELTLKTDLRRLTVVGRTAATRRIRRMSGSMSGRPVYIWKRTIVGGWRHSSWRCN